MKTRILLIAIIISMLIVLSGCDSKEWRGAKLHFNDKRWDKAIPLIEQELVTNPANQEARWYLLQCYNETEQWDKMYDTYKGITDPAYTEEAENMIKYASYQFKKQAEEVYGTDFPKCIEFYEQAAVVDPVDADIYGNIALCYNNMGEKDKAFEYMNKAIEMAPEDENIQFNLGNMYYLNQDYDQAKIEFEKTLALNPDNKWANYILGEISINEANYSESIKYFEKVIEVDSSMFDGYYFLGAALYSTGMDFDKEDKKDEAVQAFTKAKDVFEGAKAIYNPEEMDEAMYSDILLNLYQIYQINLKDNDKAIENIKLLIELDETNIDYHSTLQYLYNQTGQEEKAKEETELIQKLLQEQEGE